MSGWWTFKHVPRLTHCFSLPSYCAHTCLCACKLHFISACIHIHTKRSLPSVYTRCLSQLLLGKDYCKKIKPITSFMFVRLSLKSLLTSVLVPLTRITRRFSFTFWRRRKGAAHIHTHKHAAISVAFTIYSLLSLCGEAEHC